MSHWKILGPDVIPKGNLLKQNLPIGIMNVVSFWQFGSNGIYQNPLDVSSVEKTLAPAILGITSSSMGRI